MRVKSLEVFGFKSFPHKTTIHFEPGVTAVVGPNGSGKSNLVDSIRWVLGEHNPRDVRAPRLEDVIFNGTDQRAPLSMAEVSLTIDNAEGRLPISFSEVCLTRRVYRSGESEYFINQSPCRLKDIQELFLGTGLGGGTYAIIEQGHIDMVLSSKPEERRVVFEEASGVAKYLAKKQETTRRLDEVEEHLLRIADIIGEVRRQVSALERQANKARQYKTQWEQLKRLELRLAADELRQGQAQADELEQQRQSLDAQRAALDAQKQGHLNSLEACNAALSAIQANAQELRAQVAAGAGQIEQHESQVALKQRWIEELGAQVQQTQSEEDQLRVRLAQAEEQLARLGGGEAELQNQLGDVEAQIARAHQELTALEQAAQTASRLMTEAKARLFEAASEATHQRNQVTSHASRIQGVEAQLARLDAQASQRAEQRAAFAGQRQALATEDGALRGRLAALQQRAQQLQQSLDEAAARRHERSGRVQQAREQLASERAQAQLLHELWQRHEGFPETVKTLMEQPIDGLLGPLVDLVQPAAGAEEIVEAALGPLADALVVRDRQALARCREALALRGLEGARFLVLSDCPASVHAASPPTPSGASGSVKQLVVAQPPYQPLVDWLLGDSWLVEDMERLLAQPEVPQERLVSQRGERWDRRSWRLRGLNAGAGATRHSRFGRKQRFEHAQAKVQSLEQEIGRLEADAADAQQQWQALLDQHESAKGELLQVTPSAHKLEAQLAQLDEQLRRMDEEDAGAALEARDLQAQREELRAALGKAQQAAQEAAVAQQAVEQALAAAQAQRDGALQRSQEFVIAKAQAATMLQSLTERRQALALRQQELEGDRAQATQHIEARAQQRQDAIRRREELTQQLTGHEQGKVALAQEQQQRQIELEQVSRTLRDEEAKRDAVLPHVLAVEQQLSTLAQELAEHTQRLSERQFRRQRLVERLRELYQIDEATLEAELTTDAPALEEAQRTETQGQVEKLRAKLEGIGPVSLGSVEEYDQLKQRYEFLQSQQSDLIKARDDLKASIVQINRTARTQFRETFERIRQEFKHYYTKLFSGGEADLVLMDEEDVLECGIDIIARPPGKRLQSISLLSGGERALTAIALLFALFKVRPSPFCILDEIDAPLDEANVTRFTRVLEEFLSLSQFILITHNKKTITKADCLYGVTMEEAGISKILSAKLTPTKTEAPAPTPVAA